MLVPVTIIHSWCKCSGRINTTSSGRWLNFIGIRIFICVILCEKSKLTTAINGTVRARPNLIAMESWFFAWRGSQAAQHIAISTVVAKYSKKNTWAAFRSLFGDGLQVPVEPSGWNMRVGVNNRNKPKPTIAPRNWATTYIHANW